jgi:hypothetical protein
MAANAAARAPARAFLEGLDGIDGMRNMCEVMNNLNG